MATLEQEGATKESFASRLVKSAGDTVNSAANAVGLAQPSAGPAVPAGNQAVVDIVNTTLDHELANRVLDFYDGRELSTGLDAYKGVNTINISSYDTYIEPIYVINALGIHTAEKTDFSPPAFTFDANGNITIGGVTHTEVKALPDASFADQILGTLYLVNASDTQSGVSSVSLTSNAGWQAEYQLRDINDSGYIFVFNHSQDIKNGVATTTVDSDDHFAAGSVITTTAIADSYYIDFNKPNEMTVQGVNATVNYYPLTLTDAAVTALWYSLITDSLNLFADDLIADYSSQLKA